MCGLSYEELAPRNFSFNSPYGACEHCDGLGTRFEVDPELVVPDPELSIAEGALAPWATARTQYFARLLESVCEAYDIDPDKPFAKLGKKQQNLILHGTGATGRVQVRYRNRYGRQRSYDARFEGLIPWLQRRHSDSESDAQREQIEGYMREVPCPECGGTRLAPFSLGVTVGGHSIAEICDMSIGDAAAALAGLELSERDRMIAERVVKEINARMGFLLDVGLDYLSLSRSAATLAGGEAQRIRLASQIGSGLVGVLYVLDEPSIGLHQRDNRRLIDTLVRLRDIGNTVLVVEHDEDTIKWGAIPTGTTIPAGGVLVLYNGWSGSAADFRTAWNVPAAAGVVAVTWGDLDNSPTGVNEILLFKDASGTVRNTTNFAEDGTLWPAYVAGSSLYLKNLTGDTNVGTNWASSVAGTDGALHPTSAVYGAGDTGSPGRVGSGGTVVDVGVGQSQTDSSTHSGSERIIKQGAGTLVLSGTNSHSGGTVVAAGTLIIRNVAALGSGPLEVQAGAKVVLDVGTGTVDITSLVLANGGLVDVGTGRLTARSGLTRSSVLAAINAAKGDGSWNGTAGFTSSIVASDVAASVPRTLGYMEDPGQAGSFTIAYAGPGDTNLDGVVDIIDITNILTSGAFRYPAFAPLGAFGRGALALSRPV
ncbi:MAG: hypothetical protein EBX39_11495, partial [Actinobacteria bacterium]|nr:hypothetical protein [Actinomycetota bacterium]